MHKKPLLPSASAFIVSLVIALFGCVASASAQNFNLTIHMVGPNTGVVGVIPIGRLCSSGDGTLCTFQVASGTALKLVANSPSTPGVFSGGTGSVAACATSTCNFIMTADGELTATFDQNAGPFLSMTINLAGDGGGEVGVDNDRCQNYDYDPAHLPTQFSACTNFYAPNSVVKLEARPPVASRFETFSNGTMNTANVCAGTPCSFVLSVNSSVTASFSALQSIALTPPSATVNLNQSILFTANGTYSDAVTEPIQSGLGTWIMKAPMNVARFDLAAAVAGGRIYAMGGNAPSPCGPGQPLPCSGGTDVVEAYDPSSNAWTMRAPMPVERQGLGAGTIGGQIYAVGGSGPGPVPGSFVATLDVYDPGFNTWSPMDPMPLGPRGFMAAAVVNGKLYAIGGQDASGVLGRVEEYDPSPAPNGTWTTKASMPTPRRWMGVGVVNGIIYAVGGDNAGVSGSTIEGTKVEAYDPSSNTWTTKASLPDGGRTILSVAAIGNVLYAVGGQSMFLRSSVFAYDTVTDSWVMKTQIPFLQTQLSPVMTLNSARGESAAVALDGRLYLMGGYAFPDTHPPLALVAAFTDNVIWGTGDATVATIKNQTGTQSAQAIGKHAGTTAVTARTGPLTCGGQCATLTVTNVVANSPPTVTIFGSPQGAPAVTISVGQNLSTTGSNSGSFRDQDQGQTWTATVNYGDGAGPQALPLGPGNNPPFGPTGTFSLNHSYSQSGPHTVTVRVTDSAQGFGTATLNVNVNPLNNPQIFLGLPGNNQPLSVQEGGTWGCGSFFDQNAAGGSWTATVNYGEGAGPQSLSLMVPPPTSGPCTPFGNSTPTGVFAFDHVYNSAGTFTVNVTARNTVTGVSKSGDFTVNVTDNRCAVVTLTISGNVPFAQLPVTVTAGGESFDTEANVGINDIRFHIGEEGTYHLQFHPPAGYMATPAELDFTVACGTNLTISVQVSRIPPAITSAIPSESALWPPNHKYHSVSIAALASDAFGNDVSASCRIVSVVSNEPDNGLGDGDTANDAVITGRLTVDLRAERAGSGGGRTYTIAVQCTDESGVSSTSAALVTVPHDQ